jgi:hypothetical protein
VAGCVQQRDVVSFELEFECRCADGDAPLLLELHPVRHRVPLCLAAADRACKLDGARVQQQLLRQRRLARIGMGDDCEGTPPRNLGAERIVD